MVRHLFAQQPVIDGSGLFNQSGNGELLKQPPTAHYGPTVVSISFAPRRSGIETRRTEGLGLPDDLYL